MHFAYFSTKTRDFASKWRGKFEKTREKTQKIYPILILRNLCIYKDLQKNKLKFIYSLSYVISQNLHRRHLNESQRGYVTNKAYQLLKLENPDTSLVDVAEQFNISKRTAERAAHLDKVSSEVVLQKIADGDLTVGRASQALREAEKITGVKVTTKTPEIDKKKVQKVQEQVLIDGETRNTETPVKNKQAEEFNQMVLGGVFDGKMWRKQIKFAQETLDSMERMPGCMYALFDLVGTVQNEMNLGAILRMVSKEAKEAEAHLKESELSLERMTEIIKKLVDWINNLHHFDFKELGRCNEGMAFDVLKKRYLDDCAKIAAEADSVGKSLLGKAVPSRQSNA